MIPAPDVTPRENRAEGRPAAVSIVIVCYQQGTYLADAIESALNQTIPASEVIVVDDGSTDETAGVARSFQQVIYVRQDNQGLAAARNTGMRRSSGEYLVFLDADDRLLPNAVEAGLGCMAAHPNCAFAYGDFCRIDALGGRVPDTHSFVVPVQAYEQLLRKNVIAAHSTVIYRKSVLLDSGGFDPKLRACEDYDVYLRLSRRFPVASHPETVTEIRHHGANMTNDAARMLKSALDVLRANSDGSRRKPAYREGVAFWKDLYGAPLFGRLSRQVLTRKLDRDFTSQIIVAARYYPEGFARLFRRGMRKAFYLAAYRLLPRPVSARVASCLGYGPPRRARFGNLRRTTPVSRQFGFDRGQPVDRYYIEQFLRESAGLIHGCVLEIGDNAYTRQFGGDRVTRSDVLNLEPTSNATFVGDLTQPSVLPGDTFDAMILTQTLHVIFDIKSALETVHRSLRGGGCVLATLAGISQICRDPAGRWNDSWRLTAFSARRLFEQVFGEGAVEVRTFGNVLAANAFLQGLAASELREAELNEYDPEYQLVICVKAQKQRETGS